MSRIKWVLSVTNASTDPSVPAGTIAMFAVICPSKEFSVETSGCAEPVGQSVRKLKDAVGTTVAFRT
jgi:hypothetical protein